jgi:AraC-like DNA-binding protein
MNDNRDRIRVGSLGNGIERLDATLHGNAFAPHRHASYAIGLTVSGVQTFRFRGTQWHCLPGQCHILHPDELHDGGAGTGEAFGYKMLYVDPSLVQDALRGCALPFVRKPVLDTMGLADGGISSLWDVDTEIAARNDDLTCTDLMVTVVGLLVRAASGGSRAEPGVLDIPALMRVRELISTCPAKRHPLADFEVLTGLDRWSLARQFRAAFGTSPSRFRTQCQVDHARHLISEGKPLVSVALEAGFADQSHLSRQFKKGYGVTPAKWAAAMR